MCIWREMWRKIPKERSFFRFTFFSILVALPTEAFGWRTTVGLSDSKQNEMIHSIQDTVHDFLRYLNGPTDEQDVVQTASQKAKQFFSLFIVDVVLMGVLSVVVYGFNALGWLNTENHKITLLLEEYPLWTVFLLTVVLIPLVEEVIFRLFLKYKRNYVFQVISALFNREGHDGVLNFWKAKYSLFFYASAVLFALVHIFNYEMQITLLFLAPILVLPQFILALILGYLRVRFTFMLGYLMHALHNAFFIGLALFTMGKADPKVDIRNRDYALKIEEVAGSRSVSMHISKDSLRYVGVDLKTVISTLSHTDDDLIEGEPALLNKKITMTFAKSPKVTLNTDSLVLSRLRAIYGCDLVSKYRKQKVFEIHVNDATKLALHTPKSAVETSTITHDNKEILLENGTLEQLAKGLSMSYGIRFEDPNSTAFRLNFKLPMEDLSQLKTVLRTEYGIVLKETEKRVNYLQVTAKE